MACVSRAYLVTTARQQQICDMADKAWPSRQAAFWVVGTFRVDVEIDDLNTALPLSVTAISGVPRPLAELNVAHLREEKTFPVTAGRQARFALAIELIGQRFLFALGVTENNRAQLASIPAVGAKDLFPLDHCLDE